jgi:uncharacterized repeat protein (TIGR01451 family)
MTTGTPVARLACLATLLLAALCALAPSALADRGFTARFATNDTGDIASVANTLMTCPAGSRTGNVSCATTQGVSPTSSSNDSYNNNYDMTYVDVDSDGSTFDSSTANQSLPSGAQVLFAGLYWGGDWSTGDTAAPNASARDTVKLKLPGSSSYTTLTADTLDDSTLNVGRYQAFKNVTTLVQALPSGGNGTYAVANVQAGMGTDHYAGWTLVVAYRDTTQPARNLTVFDGLKTIRPSDAPTDIPVSGFLTPPAGQVKTEIGFVTWEGDHGLVGDTASLNGHVLSDAQHPASNFFDSRISRDGVLYTDRNPAYANALGIDSSYTDADGDVPNSATSATIRVTTSGDQYLPGVITFATEIYAPKIDQTKTVVDANGGSVEQGDTLTYTIAGTNNGQDGASGFIVRDPIPANTTYVPGSIKLTDVVAPTATAATDAAGDDRAEFDPTNGRVVARLGTGSSVTAGGNIAPTKSYSVTFKVKVNGPQANQVPQGTTITNTATSSFFSQATNTPLTATSAAAVTVKAPDLKITKTRTGAAIVAGGSTQYTLAVANVGDATTQGTVTVSDTLPAGLTATAISASGWACSSVPTAAVTCTRADAVAAGASYPDIVLSVAVDGGFTGSAANTATVAGGGDANLGNNSSTDTSPSSQSADVGIVKTASANAIDIGDEVTYTLTATNHGASTATSVSISDPLPGALTYVSSTGGCTIDPPSGVITCPVGTLHKDETATVTITARAESDGAGTSVRNTAAVSAQQVDPVPGNNTSSATVAVSGPDLAVTKTLDSPVAPRTGDTVNYTVTVRNNGPSTATAVVLMDALPAGLTGVTSDGGGACAITAGQLRCAIGTLADGASYTVHVSGTVAAGQTVLLNRASVQGAESDGDPTNNTAEVSTPVATVADLSLTKSSDPTQAVPGGTLAYRFLITNAGPDAAAGVSITDTLPAGVSYVSGDAGCSATGGVVTCATANLAAGAHRTVTITVRVATDATGIVENRATVHTTTPDIDPSNDTGTALTPVLDTADVSITKTASPANPVPGDTITYTLTAHNDGPAPAQDVKVGDTLPGGVTFTGVDSSDCTQAAGAVACAFGTLAPGATRVVTITATADPIATPHPGATHQLTDGKVEQQLTLDAGETSTVSISCGSGQILTDGSVRVDAVDQGTGDLADAQVLAAHGDGVAGYTATVHNAAPGQVQAKLFGNCLSATTSTDDGHAHDVLVSAPVTVTQSVLAGHHDATLQCGAGRTPVVPGFDFGSADVKVVTSAPTADGSGWHFAFDVLEGTDATFSVRCLDKYLSVVDGHTHRLSLERRTATVTVPAGQTVEVQVICGDDAKGIVGDYDIDPGLVALGNDPRPKTRAFRFFNPTGGDLQARVGLLCLDGHTGPETGNRDVLNAATISTSTQESATANNSAAIQVTVGGAPQTSPDSPGPVPAGPVVPPATPQAQPTTPVVTPSAKSGRATVTGRTAKLTGNALRVGVACAKGGPACVGTLTLRTTAGKVLATAKYSIKAGRSATVKGKVKAKTIKGIRRFVATATGRDGRRHARTLTITRH